MSARPIWWAAKKVGDEGESERANAWEHQDQDPEQDRQNTARYQKPLVLDLLAT